MMAARLSQRGVCPDLILTSTAKRARTTARLLAEEIGYDQVSIVADDRIYGASASEQLQVIRSTDDARTSLMLIGHNPYITELANRLGRRHIFNMPTCGILHLHINTDIWTEVGEAPVDEGFYDFPKR